MPAASARAWHRVGPAGDLNRKKHSCLDSQLAGTRVAFYFWPAFIPRKAWTC
jgi:hypothetical protein